MRSENHIDVQECIGLFKTLGREKSFDFTEQMLDACTEAKRLWKVRTPILAWLLDNCQCCIDKQSALDRFILEENWEKALVLHRRYESLEVSMQARNRMRDYDQIGLEIEYASEDEIQNEIQDEIEYESEHTSKNEMLIEIAEGYRQRLIRNN
jgi:hypothetical protein